MSWSNTHSATFGTNGTSTWSVSFPSTTAGNLLVLFVAVTSGFISSAPTNWSSVYAVPINDSTNSYINIYYYPNNPGGLTSATVNVSGSPAGEMVYGEFQETGVSSYTLDANNTNVVTSGNVTGASTSATTNYNDELVVAGIAGNIGAWNNPGGDASYTEISGSGSIYRVTKLGWTVAATPGSVSYTDSGSGAIPVIIATFGVFIAPDPFPIGYLLETCESDSELTLLRM